jgi:hypothetical protein
VDRWRAWLGLFGSAVGLAAVAAAVTFVANALLLNRMPVAAAGRYALLQSVVAATVALGGLGQPALLLRLYSRAPASFSWRVDLAGSVGWAAPLLATGALVVGAYYHLGVWQALFLVAASGLLLTAHHLSAIYASQRRHVWSNVSLRLPNSLMVVVALAIVMVEPERRLGLALAGYLLCLALIVGLSYARLRAGHAPGERRLTARERLQGLWLVANQSSTVALDQGLLIVAGALVANEEVATLAAVATLMSPLQLVWSVLTNILLSELVQRQTIRYRPMIAGIVALALTLALAAAILGPVALSWLYDGRYNLGAGLIPGYALLYFLKLVETFPRSHITGRSDGPGLAAYVRLQVALALLGIGATAILTGRLGPIGTVSGGLLLAAARAFLSYLTLWQALRSAR